MKEKKFDVFVIGSGMSGMTIANKCASKGLKVGITDELPYGGTCALRGCDPKKVIIGVTEVTHLAKHLKGKGVNSIPDLNWQEVMAFKQSFVDAMPPKIEKGYKSKDIATYHSDAKFISEDRLQIGNEVITADKFVIATGAKARELKFEGGSHALNSTNFLNLDKLPKSLIFIGGGYIAFEFAHIAKRCGADVTIIHRGENPLKNFDKDIVSHLVQATREMGIKIILNTEVTRIDKHAEEFNVIGKTDGAEDSFKAAAVFNSAGRIPGILDLQLEKANIDYSKKGVQVNEFLQSPSNSRIYAAGDASNSRGLPLTPVAVLEGHLVASNILKGNKKKINYPPMPSVVYTLPPVAAVGLTEEEAQAQNLQFEVNYNSAKDWFNAKRLNIEIYAFKTIVDKERQTLLGAHLIGPSAEETINLFALAIKTEMKIKDLKTMIFAYPTMASDIPHML